MSQNILGRLYICATPIGNLEDCSFRLIRTLTEVSLIAAEDTRIIQRLLNRYEIEAHVISLQKYNEKSRINHILETACAGKDIALVSDAGTPNISDPGAYLIEKCLEKHIPVVPIPGPSSITTALSMSGFLANQFTFAGFFPKKEAEAVHLLERFQNFTHPIVFFDTGKRIQHNIQWLTKNYEITKIAIFKELTKHYEKMIQGSPSTILSQLNSLSPKGEWLFIILPGEKETSSKDIDQTVTDLLKYGLTKQQIFAIGKDILKLPRNKLYEYLHTIQN